MKKIILALLMLISSAVVGQNIPFTNTTRILDLDTGGVMKFYKIHLPQSGYKNFYVQRSGIYIDQYTMDMRIGNVLRYMYSSNGFSDIQHNNIFHNSWSFQNGYYIGYVLDFAFSSQDTNLILAAYRGANWEPADGTGISYNNGLTGNAILPQSLMNYCGGMAIDPVNDSIMYVGFNSNLLVGNVHKSTNRGANWFCVDTLSGSIYGTKLFVNKFNRNTIFILQSSTLFRSTTGGTDFLQLKTGVPNVRMYFDSNDNTIYMSSTAAEGFLKSTNNGNNWTTLLNKAVNDFEFDPLNSNILYAGCGDGLYKSIDKGITWSLYNNSFMPDLNVKGIVKNPNSGDTLFVTTNKAVYKVYGQSIMDTASTNYFPMAVGNLYVYQQSSVYPPTTRYKVRITKDTVIAGKRFFYFDGQMPGLFQYGHWLRADGTTGVLTGVSNYFNCNYLQNERYIDSLKSRKNDTLRKCGLNVSLCKDTLNFPIFGIPSKSKTFREDGLILVERTYTKYFGLTQVYSSEYDSWYDNLIGCKINGVTYGDTTLTGVQNISTEIPSNYSLSQNFPNPFNPSTKIRFAIPNDNRTTNNVQLIIYDVMGREIQTLVNEKLQAGSYETTFDGSGLTSGVYFYRMVADNFTETKRMLMLK